MKNQLQDIKFLHNCSISRINCSECNEHEYITQNEQIAFSKQIHIHIQIGGELLFFFF